MDNPETLTTLGKQYTGKKTQKTNKQTNKQAKKQNKNNKTGFLTA